MKTLTNVNDANEKCNRYGPTTWMVEQKVNVFRSYYSIFICQWINGRLEGGTLCWEGGHRETRLCAQHTQITNHTSTQLNEQAQFVSVAKKEMKSIKISKHIPIQSSQQENKHPNSKSKKKTMLFIRFSRMFVEKNEYFSV